MNIIEKLFKLSKEAKTAEVAEAYMIAILHVEEYLLAQKEKEIPPIEAIKEFYEYLKLPKEFKEQYIPIYSPRALKFVYITNPTKVFKVAECVRGENKRLLNIEEIYKKEVK